MLKATAGSIFLYYLNITGISILEYLWLFDGIIINLIILVITIRIINKGSKMYQFLMLFGLLFWGLY